MELTATFMVLLDVFQPVFTAPSFATFRLLMTGWVLSFRHRYVTDLIVSSDSVGNGHFSDYHRFFSHAAWNIDDLWKRLATLIVKRLIGKDATIVLAGDDTLCRKRGLGIFGTGMHHDALSSSKNKKICHWGHDWVDLCIVIANPWWAPTKVFALPICMRLYRNRQGLTKGKRKSGKKPTAGQKKAASKKAKQAAEAKRKAAAKARAVHETDGTPRKTRPELMAEMLALVAGWFPEPEVRPGGRQSVQRRERVVDAAGQHGLDRSRSSQCEPLRPGASEDRETSRPRSQERRASSRASRLGKKTRPAGKRFTSTNTACMVRSA